MDELNEAKLGDLLRESDVGDLAVELILEGDFDRLELRIGLGAFLGLIFIF